MLFIRVLIAMAAGAALGIGFCVWHIRAGLTWDEWDYLKDFYTAVKAGAYVELEDDEKEKGE